MERNNQNIPEFEFKPEYWFEAEKMVVKEEKKQRFVFAVKSALAIVLIGGLTFYGFNARENSLHDTAKVKTNVQEKIQNKNQIQYKGDAIVQEKISKNTSITVQNQSIKNTNSINNPSISNHSNSKQNHHQSNITSNINSNLSLVEKLEMENMPNQQNPSGNQRDYDLMFFPLKSSKINPAITSIEYAKAVLDNQKTNSIKKEIYVSLMQYPEYGFGNLKNRPQISFNAGFLISKKLYQKWSLGMGLQYNHYRKMYQFENESIHKSENEQDVIDYYTQAENQTWTPIENPNINNGEFPVYVVSNSGTTPNSSSLDTVSFSNLDEKYVLDVRRKLKEKSAVVGSVLLPIEIQYSTNKFRFSGGLSLEYLLHNKIYVYENEHVGDFQTSANTEQKNNNFAGLNRTLFNASLGVDYTINPRFSIGVRGSKGLKDFSNNEYFNNQQNDKNFNVSLSLRYHWM